jgi:hypothetical protein
MVNVMFRTRLVGFWFVAVAIVAASVAVGGMPVSLSTTALLLTMCLVSPDHPALRPAQRSAADGWRVALCGERSEGRPVMIPVCHGGA